MPLYPAQSYTAWELACIAAGGEPRADEPDVREELRVRQIPAAEVARMVGLARRVRRHLLPVVCMDYSDLRLGLESLLARGEIDAAEYGRLVTFVDAHVDLPRAPVPPSSGTRPRRRSSLREAALIAYNVAAFLAVAEAGNRHRPWLAAGFLLCWFVGSVLLPAVESWRVPRWRAARRANQPLQRTGDSIDSSSWTRRQSGRP